jgi:hypothetical protein
MKACGIGLLVALAVLAPGRHQVSAATPHPHTLWVWSTVDFMSDAAWSVTVRTGGYYTGYAGWIHGEFNGQLSASQLDEFAGALERLPRSDRSYHFGTESIEGPALILELQHPGPMTRYRVAVVGDHDRGDPRLQSISRVAELLLRLVPQPEGRAATPWRLP